MEGIVILLPLFIDGLIQTILLIYSFRLTNDGVHPPFNDVLIY